MKRNFIFYIFFLISFDFLLAQGCQFSGSCPIGDSACRVRCQYERRLYEEQNQGRVSEEPVPKGGETKSEPEDGGQIFDKLETNKELNFFCGYMGGSVECEKNRKISGAVIKSEFDDNYYKLFSERYNRWQEGLKYLVPPNSYVPPPKNKSFFVNKARLVKTKNGMKFVPVPNAKVVPLTNSKWVTTIKQEQ